MPAHRRKNEDEIKMNVTVIGKYGPYGKAGVGAASCYLVENNGEYLVMDMGAGTLSRLMAAVDMKKVNYIYFSQKIYVLLYFPRKISKNF